MIIMILKNIILLYSKTYCAPLPPNEQALEVFKARRAQNVTFIPDYWLANPSRAKGLETMLANYPL